MYTTFNEAFEDMVYESRNLDHNKQFVSTMMYDKLEREYGYSHTEILQDMLCDAQKLAGNIAISRYKDSINANYITQPNRVIEQQLRHFKDDYEVALSL